jgi:hypothetical protein
MALRCAAEDLPGQILVVNVSSAMTDVTSCVKTHFNKTDAFIIRPAIFHMSEIMTNLTILY